MANKKSNYYPVQTDLVIGIAAGSGLGVIRIDRELSGLNRRLYRQNRVYRVKVDAVGSAMGEVDVFRLRNTFMLQRGYGEAMKAWNESFEAAEEVVKETSMPRWRDFRIDVKPHVGDTLYSALNLRSSGTGVASQSVVIDEYNTSIAYTPTGTSKDFGIRADSNTFDIISEYNKMGKVQPSPVSGTTEAAYEELNSDLNDNQVNWIQVDGNSPPYDADDMHPLDVLEYVGTIFIDADGTSRMSTGYFDAPLGAVFVQAGTNPLPSVKAIDSGNTNVLKLVVQKGDYKGVAAHEFVDASKME